VAFWGVLTESAPWLLLGFAVAAILKAFLSEAWLGRQLGKRGTGSVVKAAVLGAPMPLCSCGVLPVAIGLRNQKASRGATTAFLISTPETSADSVALTYALTGPVMTIVRPVAAVVTAITAGIAENIWGKRDEEEPATPAAATNSCCSSQPKPEPAASDCCDTSPTPTTATPAKPSLGRRLLDGFRYVSQSMMRDIGGWLILGIAVAAIIQAALPDGWFANNLGTGWTPMLLMLVVGIPLYICATASTPVAASLLIAGVSPGAVLVFLLVGPATNIATMLVIYRTMGLRSLAIYLGTIILFSLAFGFGLDQLLASTGWTVAAEAMHAHDHSVVGLIAPISAGLLLALLANAYLWPIIGNAIRKPDATAAPSDSCCN